MRRARAVKCLRCAGRAELVENVGEYASHPTSGRGYACSCGWVIDEYDIARHEREFGKLVPDDGRIRGADDAIERLAGALERAAVDKRLSPFDRSVHAIYCDRAAELGWVEIMASDYWVCERLGLDPAAHRNRVRRSRDRLAGLNYVRRLKLPEVTSRHLKAAVEARKGRGKKLPTLLEVRKAPPLPTCERCGAEMPDAVRVSMRFCGAACRKAAGRHSPRLNALLEAALPGVSR